MAEYFAAQGHAVALLSRTRAQLDEVAAGIEQAGGRALALPCDVTDQDAVREAMARAAAELGPVEVLINNAGSFDAIGPLWEVDPLLWWRDCEINLRGPMLTCHAALPAMIRRRRGLIINVIGGGTGNPFPYGSGYASSKAALMRLTESLARETREHGISVVAMGPGFVRTAMTELQLGETGRRWIPSSAASIADGTDIPPTRAAALAFALTARRDRLQPLTGRLFNISDDVDEVLSQSDDIIAANRRTLRFCE